MDEMEAEDQTAMEMEEYEAKPQGPLLLQLWSYKRLAVGRSIVSHEPYHEAMYGDEEDDRPTMGTLCN